MVASPKLMEGRFTEEETPYAYPLNTTLPLFEQPT